jgi:hypothetical protein
MPESGKMVKLSTRIPSVTADELKRYCDKYDYLIQEIVSDAIYSYLIRRQRGSKP